MRSRTVREGSVGLFILLGLILFGGTILWLRGLAIGNRSYKVVIEFANIAGMEDGAQVRYRGVAVGKITKTRPGPNGVEVEVEISPADLVIPRDVVVEANQSGLLGSTSIDINPVRPLTVAVETKPLDRDCNRDLILCNNSRLPGQIGVSVDELIRSAIQFANVYSDPKFFANVNAVVKNSAEAASEVAKLSREFSSVAKVTREQLPALSESSRAITLTANKLGVTADQVNGLLVENRLTLVSTLNNINQLTSQLRSTVTSLNPTVNRLQQGELLRNLETLSANAVQASANLRDVSQSLNNPANLAILQQTLDSARATFQNAQKITSDLDELTGDPTFRKNLRDLVNSLSNLVSSTQQLEKQTQLAKVLQPIAESVSSQPERPPTPGNQAQLELPASPPQPRPEPSSSAGEKAPNKPE